MKVKVEKFCALSSSPSWQAWLYHFNADIYNYFIKRLRESRNCSQSRDLMIEVLGAVDKANGGEKLFNFLQQHYPNILIQENSTKPTPQAHTDEIFEHYNPQILTYPRRMILTGSARELKMKVQSFLIDKIIGDHIIVGDKAYIEYLTRDDIHIKDSVPQKNWAIAAYRLRSTQN